jgi:stage II sporulation protein D
VILQPRGAAPVVVNGKAYRGFVRLTPTDTGLLVVNELPVEQYLRGVVPLEIGARRPDELAAVEAQAIAARSYTYARLRSTAAQAWDMRGTTADQVYGGVAAERAQSDAAIAATADVVLTFGGQVVDAPYSASCGGETAAADEVYRSPGVAYLQRVSDRRPEGGESYYCDGAPNFRWTRSIAADSLREGIQRYLRTYVRGVPATVGPLRDVRVTGSTPSGRAAGVEIRTRAGDRWTVERNDLRFVLRSVGGAIVPSTYLSLAAEQSATGALTRLVITGRGNGHGVGMCQWGAIGRARAGQDARTILRTYYPGTELRRADN